MHIVKQIFGDFEKEKVKYCHFKSNQHLDESFNGDTDFDIIVDFSDKDKCESILLNYNCKQFEPEWIGRYPGVENWLAFDPDTGKIFHIHLHYQIATGKLLVKDYVLPWTKLILETAKKQSDYSIYVANPNIEIIILLTRLIVKSDFRTRFKALFGVYKLNKYMENEYIYLKERIDSNELKKFANIMFSPYAAQFIENLILNKSNISAKDFLSLSKIVRRELRLYRRMSSISANIKSMIFRIIISVSRRLNRLFDTNFITKKVTNSGGKIITFIGVDGSGKSTISSEINKWLGKKIECKRVYLGAGDGPKNLFATVVSYLLSKKKKASKITNKNQNNYPQKNKSILTKSIFHIKKLVQSLLIYSIVRDNHKRIKKMHSYRLNGGFSITDRYPQLQHENMNDGIKIKSISRTVKSRIINKLSIQEQKKLQIVNEIYPDLVFRLNISAETSMKRKPDQSNIEYFALKAEKIKELDFSKSKLFEINAEKDLEDVLLEIKKIIWNNI